jgi:hypothetical protein
LSTDQEGYFDEEAHSDDQGESKDWMEARELELQEWTQWGCSAHSVDREEADAEEHSSCHDMWGCEEALEEWHQDNIIPSEEMLGCSEHSEDRGEAYVEEVTGRGHDSGCEEALEERHQDNIPRGGGEEA